jgi:dTDP-4-dehydrorhamnose 3,5-epimerase
VHLTQLVAHSDDRGFFMEMLRSDDGPLYTGFGQSSYTESYPGVIKAFHWHRRQDDVWVVLSGMAQVVMHDLREDSPSKGLTQVVYMGEQRRVALFIPRGVAHGYRALGTEPVRLVYHTTNPYNPEDPDEERIPWDDPKIGFDWSTKFR